MEEYARAEAVISLKSPTDNLLGFVIIPSVEIIASRG